MNEDPHIYLGLKGHVTCFERDTGREVWRTQLKGGSLTTVLVDGDMIFAYTQGHLFGLDRVTGDRRWTNELPGLGWGYGIIATERSAEATLAALAAASAEAAAASAAAAS